MTLLRQVPEAGVHKLFFRGDTVEFRLTLDSALPGKAFLRTNIGNSKIKRQAIIDKVEEHKASSIQDWHDIPMLKIDELSYYITVALREVGHFEAKCCFFPVDSNEPLWSAGENVHINVEPAEYCCANSIYCAFVRQFGRNRTKDLSLLPENISDKTIQALDEAGYAVIPPSGTFRDLEKQLDFIVDKLNCRIIHLLPINPTPTVYGRMGRFGSPYAALDFTSVDPALAEFDRKATPLDQFLELVDAVHRKNARIFLDIAINHTGWAAKIHEEHPEWLVKEADGTIHSPGAWGVVWGDLTELNHEKLELWDYMADMFMIWCERGVDGFRCDAGYMIPEPAWEYIICRVRTNYPDTIFLLEGLGGDPMVTLKLLDHANMNWAYSELFQNYSSDQIQGYLNYAQKISLSDGLMVHYAETHDNSRLAATSTVYAKMRTALCALTSSNGAFGFANGVEWFATEKIDVHKDCALNWDAEDNQVDFIARLNTILIALPVFHNGAKLKFMDSGNKDVLVFLRTDNSEENKLLVAINLNCENSNQTAWTIDDSLADFDHWIDLVSGSDLSGNILKSKVKCSLRLQPGQVFCLTDNHEDLDRVLEIESKDIIRPDRIEIQKARALVLDVLCFKRHSDAVPGIDIASLGEDLLNDPVAFIKQTYGEGNEIPLVKWNWPEDHYRKVMIPPRHMLLVTADCRFRVSISRQGEILHSKDSLKDANGNFFVLLMPPSEPPLQHQNLEMHLAVYGEDKLERHCSELLLLAEDITAVATVFENKVLREAPRTFLATNGRGGMCHSCLEWSEFRSRYDAMLGANLSPDFPEDRHIMWRRCRMWVIYHGRTEMFNLENTRRFIYREDGGGTWKFHLPVGNGLFVDISVAVTMVPGKNAVRMFVFRHNKKHMKDCLTDDKTVRVLLRPDLEDRNFHFETKALGGPEAHWPRSVSNTDKTLSFKPDSDRELFLSCSKGHYKPSPEWKYNLYQPNEADRGLEPYTDLYSPGYFDFELAGGNTAEFTGQILTDCEPEKVAHEHSFDQEAAFCPASPAIDELMLSSMNAYIVKRDEFKTVIAGYPWFLDWGRDTLICARGLIAAGKYEDVKKILVQFGKFAKDGILPNIIHGEHVGNWDTSDAPLWFFVACSDMCKAEGDHRFLDTKVDSDKTLREVLKEIAAGYIAGTPNGIKMDENSGLIFSPAHFTWMDTNYPAGTPREGYPIEIQALWHAALTFLASANGEPQWQALADQVNASIVEYFMLPEQGYLSDCLHCQPDTPASKAVADDHLRPNQLFALTLGAVKNKALGQSILDAVSALLIPGAIRTLADCPVEYELPVMNGKQLLNDPHHPYWGHYAGNEDSRRKPAYHNGTAWTWPFPSYCEAYYQVYGQSAGKTAKAILSSTQVLLNEGCVGHLPEIVDGNLPHCQKGCDAQAWGATELYRVWKILDKF